MGPRKESNGDNIVDIATLTPINTNKMASCIDILEPAMVATLSNIITPVAFASS